MSYNYLLFIEKNKIQQVFFLLLLLPINVSISTSVINTPNQQSSIVANNLSSTNSEELSSLNVESNFLDIEKLTIISYPDSDYNLLNISSDEDLNQFPGTGIKSDPFILDDLTALGYDYVRITNVTKHFIIQNSQFNTTKLAISISDISPNISEIRNCKFFVPFPRHSYLFGFNIPYSLFFLNVEGLNIYNNQFLTCNGGINIYNCSEINIADNYFYNLSFGIIIAYTDSSRILNNLFYKCIGVTIQYCNNLIIENNKFFESGIQFSSVRYIDYRFGDSFYLDFIPYSDSHWFDDHVINNNYVNNKKLGFFYNISRDKGIDFSKFGQLLLINCSDFCLSDANFSNTHLGFFLLTVKIVQSLIAFLIGILYQVYI